jgi:HPt (histidine-containing phosphotransfer) domain-containing protein
MVDWKMIPRVTIEVEPDLIDLIPDFLARKRADLATIKAALDGGDLSIIAALAHKMKGEGGSFGFDVMTELGGALEATAKKGDRESARLLATDLFDYLEKLEVVEGPES